ncbi:MAG: hypothetical protein K6G78_06315 [bacterium]|nr:hypothetical protein [bacterium]
MNGLNTASRIIAKIGEVIYWIIAAAMIPCIIATATGKMNLGDAIEILSDGSAIDLAASGFSIETTAVSISATELMIFFITLLITAVLMAMIFRNVYLIFKTAIGKTKRSIGPTPFQPETVRMTREIGYFAIAIPLIQLVISIIAGFAFGGTLEMSVDLGTVAFGIIVLCLSQFFTYGMQLQQEVDGLV